VSILPRLAAIRQPGLGPRAAPRRREDDDQPTLTTTNVRPRFPARRRAPSRAFRRPIPDPLAWTYTRMADRLHDVAVTPSFGPEFTGLSIAGCF
jgi:hypothetical protein